MEKRIKLAASPFTDSAFVTRVKERVIVPAIQFGGQAVAYWDELALAYRESLRARALIDEVLRQLSIDAASQEAVVSGMLPHGFAPLAWLHDEQAVPSPTYLQSSAVSQSLIFLTQMAQVVRLQDSLPEAAVFLDKSVGFFGHSQGIMSALCCAHAVNGEAFTELVTKIARFFFWQGIRMQQAFLPVSVAPSEMDAALARGEGTPSSMASLHGLTVDELQRVLAPLNATFPAHRAVYRSLTNQWNQLVVSGHPESLLLLRSVLAQQETRWQRDPITRHKKIDWQFLATSAPFHSPYMAATLDAFRKDLARCRIDFDPAALRHPVYSTATGENLQQSRALLDDLLQMQWVRAVDWPAVLRAGVVGSGATHILDFGPGDSTARLTARAQRGTGVAVIAAATDSGRSVLLTDDASKIPSEADWTTYRPRVVQVASDSPRVWLDNAFTRFAKMPPIFGAGMTPTSAETEIVAAAANAGYLQEWAGGGQVTEAIWAQRRDELAQVLQPGRGVIFNALFLDPYLWRLHYPAILEQKRHGFPYIGLTISAGIPDVDAACEMLRELNAVGMWCNAFKPGNDAQIEQVLAIADGVPEIDFVMQVEGGKAGGHHSWEDLQGLIVRHYAAIRRRKNVVLCVGGGIARPEQAAAWLWGDWPGHPDLPPMPVDGVFVGTRLMACKEAKTSPQVKKLLVQVKGTSEWVRPGEIKGGMTSQKSQLNADVHFADTTAARCGALLDRLAGKPRAEIVQHRAEIIELLNQTAKPYFGELETMTYAQVLARLIECMAPGNIAAHLPHDGPWYDPSFRDRAFRWAQRLEARCASESARLQPSKVRDAAQLDEPAKFLRSLTTWYPRAAESRLHPEDIEYFLYLCRLPGKPVNFVPVIDEQVRRWYKADSLWQSHDPAYAADAVLTIPGPEAVSGILRIDEPIAEILASFEAAVIERVRVDGPMPLVSFCGEAPQPERIALCSLQVIEETSGLVTHYRLQTNESAPDANEWLAWIASRGHGPLRALLLADQWLLDGKPRPNLARGQLIPQRDEEWSLEVVDGLLAQLTTPWCTFTVRKDRITWSILHRSALHVEPLSLHLPLAWHPETGATPIHNVPAEWRTSVAQFYGALFGEKGRAAPKFAIGARFVDTVEVTLDAIRAYAAATGDQLMWTADGRCVAPPMMSIAHAWKPLADVLLACGEVGDLLRLVHARHHAEFPQASAVCAGDRVQSELTIVAIEQTPTGLNVQAEGVVRRDKEVVARIETVFFVRGGKFEAKLAKIARAESPEEIKFLANPYELFTTTIHTPMNAAAYAAASGDHNPIHLDPHVAAVAQFPAPIIQGMWSAAVMVRECVRHAGASGAQRLAACDVAFTSPVAFDQTCTVQARHVAMADGGMILESRLETPQAVAVTGRVQLHAPRVAYLFTGQGAQMQGMGMEAYARSAAARTMWDRADDFCRSKYGFSIVQIVRDNPKLLRLHGADGRVETLRHPQGVLHLTQFTQVALTVVAMASVAELREAGCYAPDALFAGHSLGEYAALAAAEIMPYEELLTTVYHRGLTMQHFVPRDAHGRSPYRMAVVRPNLVGLDEKGLATLIATTVQGHAGSLEIVNFNIDGEQYSVTGDEPLLRALETALLAMAQARGVEKTPLIWLEGIDVPFHSTVLREGVADFRKTLEGAIPARIDPARLIGHYIPNLNAEPFAITREYVTSVATLTESPVLRRLLARADKDAAWRASDVARTLLIELLAYQFASPVQWIATQRLLMANPLFGVEQLIEIGPQPVLANMARRSVKRWGILPPPAIAHVEQERREVFYLPATAEEARVLPVDALPPLATVRATAAHPQSPAPSGAGLVDEPLSVVDTLNNLLALKLRLRPDEIRVDDTIEKLTRGNSARRNEILADLGAEFNVGVIEEAHQKPLSALYALLSAQAKYTNPGPYFRVATDQAIKEHFPMSRSDLVNLLQSTWDVGPGRTMAILNLLPLAVRMGNSTGSGALSPIGIEGRLGNADKVQAWFAGLVQWYGELKKVTVPPRISAAHGAAAQVDAAVLNAFEAKYFGRDGVLGHLAVELLRATGTDPYARVVAADQALLEESRTLQLYRRAFGPAVERMLAPQFDANKVVTFSSTWNWTRCRIVELFWRLMRDETIPRDELAQINAALQRCADREAIHTLHYYIQRARDEKRERVATVLQRLCTAAEKGLDKEAMYCPTLVSQRPLMVWEDGRPHYREAPRENEPTFADTIESVVGATKTDATILKAWQDFARHGLTLSGKTICVTGAGPDSIGAEIVRICLRAGARVIVGSSRLDQSRVHGWRAQFAAEAARGAELLLVPMNQGSQEDCQRIIEWIYAQYGALDALFPFAAVRETGDLTSMSADAATVTWRVLLQSVEWLIAAVAAQNAAQLRPPHATTIILPGSPNHGMLGGDGAYGAAKAALEVITNRWRAEYEAWGRHVALIGARIGWTRGTGLMKANDLIAGLLEAKTSCRTFSTEEMALLLVGLLHPTITAATTRQPLWVSLTGGFEAIPDIAHTFHGLRKELEQTRPEPSNAATSDLAAPIPYKIASEYFAFPPLPTDDDLQAVKKPDCDPRDVYVIVGFGEVSPYGNARTRWQVECGSLSTAACLELAWLTGRIRFERTPQYVGWLDVTSGEPVADHELQARYERVLLDESGIRLVDAHLQGFDPQAMTIYADVQLANELRIPIESPEEGAAILQKYPDQAEIVEDRFAQEGSRFSVRLPKGAVIKVPQAGRIPRYVAGQIPTGWDPARYGVPQDLIAQVDRNTLFNFVATVDAFFSMGATPEELQQSLHPTRIANTQGGGMGGQRSLERLFHDYREGRGRQGDTLQETLINVMAGWITQSYVGSYGPSVHPVGACATAVVSLDTAVNLLASDKADFVVAGGYDDISAEGVIGFHDMEATADIDAMRARGVDLRTISRPNDRRRGGFVEAQGGGTFLVTRLSQAVDLGLPIYAVVAHVGTHSDGIHTSIPAPGLGLLGMVTEFPDSASREGKKSPAWTRTPLGAALARFGLTADDITVVSKHDTSTKVNDPNENHLHHLMQIALERSPGNPLMVHSQKALLGHAKGGAGAWQIAAAMQMMNHDLIVGNPHLEDVDPAMHEYTTLNFPAQPIPTARRGVRAVVLTSLGFGHVGAGALLIHPDYAVRCLSVRQRAAYAERRAAREQARIAHEWRVRLGTEPAFVQRREKPYSAEEEVTMLRNGKKNLY